MHKVALIRDPLFLEHSNGPGHPERPERLQAIDAMLARFSPKEGLEDIPARDATSDELAYVHEPVYIRRIADTAGGGVTMLDPDTGAGARSYAAAVRAAGGTVAAVDAVVGGGYAGAFALVRPPGHHAEAGRAMGFCLFNNVAVAAEHALRKIGLSRVLVIDWDVHHGNGTMHSFYDSREVLYFSVHQYPHYPGTGLPEESGSGLGRGFTVNVALPYGQGDAEYIAVLSRVLVPVALEYEPELILVSAGFDVHESDPLAGMGVTYRGFEEMTKLVMHVGRACCPGRVVHVLEGGYDLQVLDRGVETVLRTMLDAGETDEDVATGEEGPRTAGQSPGSAADAVLERVLAHHRGYWKSL